MPTTTVSAELVESLVRLGRVFRSTHPELDKAAGGLRRNDHALLAYLDAHGTCRVGDVADALTTSPSVVSRQVAALTSEGLVARTTCPDDGRVGLISMTAEGLARLEEGRAVYRAYVADLLADWDEERMRVATDVLNDLAEVVHRNFTADHRAR